MATDLSSQLPLTSAQPEVGSYHDLRSLNALRTLGQKDETAALRAAAKQFESVFMQMMMKSMREANESFEADDLFGSNDGDFYQQMHDEQMALALSEKQTFGLAELMVRQLQRNQGSLPVNTQSSGAADQQGLSAAAAGASAGDVPRGQEQVSSRPVARSSDALRPETQAMFSPVAFAPTQVEVAANASLFMQNTASQNDMSQNSMSQNNMSQSTPVLNVAAGSAIHTWNSAFDSKAGVIGKSASVASVAQNAVGERAAVSGSNNSDQTQLGFIKRLLPHAERAAKSLGTSPMVLLAQAALETGWGQSQLAQADSARGNNFFGIKADARWDGERVGKRTVEYSDGKPGWQQAWFRAYDSVASAFDDYVSFVKDSPRYSQAIAGAREPHSYLDGLVKGGYATDPQYARKVMTIAGSEKLADLVNQARELLANP